MAAECASGGWQKSKIVKTFTEHPVKIHKQFINFIKKRVSRLRFHPPPNLAWTPQSQVLIEIFNADVRF